MPVPASPRRRVRAGAGAVVLVLCAAVLAACGGTGLPFSKSGAANSGGRTSPQVAVREITGLPHDKAVALVNALAVAAAQRGIEVVGDAVAGGYVLDGQFQTQPTGTGTAVGYSWTLVEADDGQLVHEIADNERARAASHDLWSGVDEDVTARIAAYTAERLSSRFSQLGFATRIAGLPPPVDHMVEAGPGAEQDIDFETLYGPNAIAAADPAPETEMPEPETPLPKHAEAAPAEARPSSGGESGPDDGEAAGSIRAVAVAGVTGARGKGNGELSGALKRVLSGAGWPLQDRPGKGTLAIFGDISIGKPRGDIQTVALRWTVKAPDGQVLGTVEQANDVPAGSLDEAWGKAADYAAQAAAEGIFDLVNRLR